MNLTQTATIHLARTAGFCFGVKRAIRMAHELAQCNGTPLARHWRGFARRALPASSSRRGEPGRVCMLGDLVHNRHVICQLEKAGIKKIARLGNGRGKTLLIRAHGAGNRLMEQARRRGYTIADATCPMVRAIHKIVRQMDRRGYRIIVLGDRRHEEVQGIVGQIRKKPIVIESRARIPWNQIRPIKRAAIVVQSTQNMDEIIPIVGNLKLKIKEVKFFNTICRPTRMKQTEMKVLPLQNDVVIVIGSRSSANTKRLYQIARALNPRSYWLESAAQIKKAWFKNAHSIGITAGASTPESATRAVTARIRQITG